MAGVRKTSLCLLLLFCSLAAFGTGPAKVTVADTLYDGSGNLLSGTIQITNTSTFISPDGFVIPSSSRLTVPVVNGAFTVDLVPNVGSSPSGTSYRVIYNLPGHAYPSEIWVIPNSPGVTQALIGVRTLTAPIPSVQFAASQLNPPNPCTANQVFQWSGTAWQCSTVNGVGGSGSVTQVTFSIVPSWLSAAVATNTTTPDIHLAAATGLAANLVLATPDGVTGAVGPRALVSNDIPALSESKITNLVSDLAAKQAALGFTPLNAANNLSDVVSAVTSRTNLGLGTAATHAQADFSGTGACLAHQWAASINGNAAPTCTQPGFSDVGGSVAPSQLPTPGATTLGGVEAKTCTGTDKVSAIGTDGVPVCTADQLGAAGGGITSLNGLTAATQDFATQNDTNVTITIDSSVSPHHKFTLGWTGTLAKGRTLGTTVYTDQANSYTAGDKQTFVASTTTAGANLAGVTADPSGLAAGDYWFRTDLEHFRFRDNAGTPVTHSLFNSDDNLPGAQVSGDIGGNAANVTGVVTEAHGGTGSANTAGAAGHVLRSNGTHYVDSAIQAADVPTLNQNTTGTSANVTGIVAEANGGTGANNVPGTAGHTLRSNGTHYVDAQLGFGDVSGTVSNAQLANSYSGVGACAASNWVHAVNANAAPTCTQPAFSDLAGSATTAQLPGSGATTVGGATCTLGSTCTVTRTCEFGLGDGANAITAASTYTGSGCFNDLGATYTITAVRCFSDNNGTSTTNPTNDAGTALLTGALTCSNAFASGTQSATTTITNGHWIKFPITADGTSKSITVQVTYTR